MSKETTKAKITALRALLADNSITPETLGIVLDEILELDTRGYKVYSCLLNQGGIDAPVPTVLENTFNGNIIWTRTSIGTYLATLVGAFPNNEKLGIPSIAPSVSCKNVAYYNNADSIEFYSSNSENLAQDLGYYGQLVEIRYYN
jgi:hypothetical protein